MLSKSEFLSYLIGERKSIMTCNYWIPAFAGMTVKEYVGLFTNVSRFGFIKERGVKKCTIKVYVISR